MSKHKKLRNDRKINQTKKMSEIIAEYAGDFLACGSDLYEKQNNLNCACTAWNISLLPKTEIKQKVNSVVAFYEKINPEINESDNLRYNLEQLIKRKLELYPDIRTSIVRAIIEDDHGKNCITILSMAHD